MYDDARRLLFSADEDFGKNSGRDIEPGYGYLRIWDYSNLAAPVQIGEYRTPNSGGRLPLGSGDYTIHNPMLMGTDVYISWYSDGVRVVDASDPTNPVEVAYFVPPAGQNPVSRHSGAPCRRRRRSGASSSTRRPGSSMRAI